VKARLLVVAFVLTYLLPGDPARALAGERYREEDVARIRHELGLDRPGVGQYAAYLGKLGRGDLGDSFATGRPVAAELAERFPRTMLLAVASMTISVLLGLGLGVLAAWRKGGLADRLSMLFALTGTLTPHHVFVIGILAGLVNHSDLVMRNALIGDTMPTDTLMKAMGISRTTMDSARIAGALIGAGLFS